jgi:hypothetical protein
MQRGGGASDALMTLGFAALSTPCPQDKGMKQCDSCKIGKGMLAGNFIYFQACWVPTLQLFCEHMVPIQAR